MNDGVSNRCGHWRWALSTVAVALLAGSTFADAEPMLEWTFFPDSRLPKRASASVTPMTEGPQTYDTPMLPKPPAIPFMDKLPTDRVFFTLPGPPDGPVGPFTIEFWLTDHSRPDEIAAALLFRDQANLTEPTLWLSYTKKKRYAFNLHTRGGETVSIEATSELQHTNRMGWRHIVGTYDGTTAKLYLNGESLAERKLEASIDFPEKPIIEMAGYFDEEPYMTWSHNINRVGLYEQALTQKQIETRFRKLADMVSRGIYFEDRFHFTAGPYLNMAAQNSINLLWETDRAAKAIVEWGETAELGQKKEIVADKRIAETTLTGLKPHTPYFYRITAIDPHGQRIQTPVLTFQTAVKKGEPFMFAIIADTESRPHINNQLSRLIWDERPNFVINAGDLTDGGKEPCKEEWNYQYFLGIGNLGARIPFFPVPGNGEGDLYHYNRFHNLPAPEGYYTFSYGDVDFFMLDSNLAKNEFKPGGKQYEWLEEQLKKSTAKFKIAAHHHPTYTSEEDDHGDAWKEKSVMGNDHVRQILPLYEKYGMDMVIFGHLHLYERTLPMREGRVNLDNGVVHLLCGGGGGHFEDFAPNRAYFTAKTHRGYHYVTVQVQGDRLIGRMYDIKGAMRDQFEIKAKKRGDTTGVAGVTQP